SRYPQQRFKCRSDINQFAPSTVFLSINRNTNKHDAYGRKKNFIEVLSHLWLFILDDSNLLPADFTAFAFFVNHSCELALCLGFQFSVDTIVYYALESCFGIEVIFLVVINITEQDI